MTEPLPLAIGTGALALVGLALCAEIAVRKLLGLAAYLGLSSTFIGLTVFSVTTSLPEISAHLTASAEILAGNLDYRIASATVLGANIGSDVVQQTLLLGLVVLLMGGFTFSRVFLLTAYLPMIGTTLMCLILGWDRTYSRLDGAVLLGAFFLYMGFLHKQESRHAYGLEEGGVERSTQVRADVFLSAACLVGMLISAHFFLGAIEQIVMATELGGSLIGVVTLGLASASPEFVTAISGVRHKAAGVSLGTLIGSNITNPLVAIGGGALLSTYWVPAPLIYWDLVMETLTATALLVFLLLTGGRLGRWGGLYLVTLYGVYIGVRLVFFAVD